MTTIYRTCNSDQLECLTEQGWVIDQTQHEDDIGWLSGSQCTQRKLVFVLKRDDEGPLAKAIAAEGAALLARDKAHAAALNLEREAEALRDKLDSTDRLRLELAAKVNELNTRLAATGKMERDIAKLRAALGDLRMREILDGE